MNEDAAFGRAPMLTMTRTLVAPLAEVWRSLTDVRALPDWYGKDALISDYEGGNVRFKGAHIRGVITQWKPQWRLAYAWNVYNPGDDVSDYPESYVTFELVERDDRINLTLTHLPVLERFEKQNAMGWHTYLDMVVDCVDGNPVKPVVDYMKINAAKYGVDLGNLTK
jgi:uncharacterized protein YndB with AHSA1/START domain